MVNNQVKFSIIAIAIIIPLSSYSVWASDSNLPITKSENSQKLQIISSFYPLYDFAQNVGKDKVEVFLLIPEGVEPHDWEPTIQDVQLMQKSDLIIINGIGFERWVEKLEIMNYQGIILDTSKGITNDSSFLESNNESVKNSIQENDHELGDPHIWLNPAFAQLQVQSIANEFSELDPENKKFYEKNAQDYISKLDKLDKKIRNELSNCNHDFIAFHDAFSYFANEYHLNQHTIISSNDPHIDPTGKTLENVIKTARELNIKIIFTEDTVNPKISNVIANEIGGKTLVLSPIEISGNGNYISKMNDNLENLKEALC